MTTTTNAGIGTIGRMVGDHVFYDCEFKEDGKTIRPISIAMVSDHGEYYAINRDANFADMWTHPFLSTEVLPHLPFVDNTRILDFLHPDVKPLKQIRSEVSAFVLGHDQPNLWSWYSSYDHVMVAQLFGTMLDLPAGFPMQTDDLKTICKYLGNPRLPVQKSKQHNALADARYHREIFLFLQEREQAFRFEDLLAAAADGEDA